jgi:hypothetical protein
MQPGASAWPLSSTGFAGATPDSGGGSEGAAEAPFDIYT